MKRIAYFIILALITSLRCLGVVVNSTNDLKIFYPEFSKIDFVCEKMPDFSQKDVIFCCEAAFTGQKIRNFKHTNIADNHICNGLMKTGYNCKANTGGFIWNNDKWSFVKKENFPATSKGWRMGFCQRLLIYEGVVEPIWEILKNKYNYYRALCEKNGKLCIIESKNKITLEQFVFLLGEFKVKYAIYLDMGAGWNYAWYRDKKGSVIELFPESKKSSNFKYRTNWITFYK